MNFSKNQLKIYLIKEKNSLISHKYLTILNSFSHKIIIKKTEYDINKGKFEYMQFAMVWLNWNEFNAHLNHNDSLSTLSCLVKVYSW